MWDSQRSFVRSRIVTDISTVETVEIKSGDGQCNRTLELRTKLRTGPSSKPIIGSESSVVRRPESKAGSRSTHTDWRLLEYVTTAEKKYDSECISVCNRLITFKTAVSETSRGAGTRPAARPIYRTRVDSSYLKIIESHAPADLAEVRRWAGYTATEIDSAMEENEKRVRKYVNMEPSGRLFTSRMAEIFNRRPSMVRRNPYAFPRELRLCATLSPPTLDRHAYTHARRPARPCAPIDGGVFAPR
ncbi:hypothetical protein EVAR_29407_1 [Eumeta japonica]|uniref:Uncharacterized protein n=1 Tax=Eumeta variegata TaxID=151549 RepID=A0A4C1VUK7_EUMVA|nr:hypothetical protein EVAR_29407_1 [Eumeta japonica]